MMYTLRVKFQDNQGVVQFRNGSDETAHLRKNKVVGVLDLRSIRYFKVGYQNMVNMAESGKAFKMYHYQQIKCCERLKSQNRISTELEADWQSWWSCKQLPLPINSCYEAALAGWCILSSMMLELL